MKWLTKNLARCGTLLLLASALFSVRPAARAAEPVEPIAIEFMANWCEGCRAIEPELVRLKAAGYAIQQVNIDHENVSFGVPGMTFKAKTGAEAVAAFAGPVERLTIPRLFVVWRDDSGLHVVPVDTSNAVALGANLRKAGLKPLPLAPQSN